MAAACSKIPIKDKEFCYDTADFGASCFNTSSENERDIPKQDWDKTRVGWGCLSPDDIGALKAEIEKLCHSTKLCTPDFKHRAEIFFEKSEKIHRRLEF